MFIDPGPFAAAFSAGSNARRTFLAMAALALRNLCVVCNAPFFFGIGHSAERIFCCDSRNDNSGGAMEQKQRTRIAFFSVAAIFIVTFQGTRAADECLEKPNAPSPQGSHWYY